MTANTNGRRVVITGIGAITPAGAGADTLWNKLMAGECCISALPEELAGDSGVSVGGIIPDYDPVALGLSKKEAHRFAKFVQMAVIASDEAMKQSGLNTEEMDTSRFACIFGSTMGGLEEFRNEAVKLHERGAKKVSPLFAPTVITNMAAGNLAIRYGLRGACTDISTACATGTHCIGEAFRLIHHGYADYALAGGTEEGADPIAIAGFGNLRALTKAEDPKAASMPFDINRGGFVTAEGSGAVVMETLESALERGADIIAEVVGFGSTGDGYHMTAPSPDGEGATRAMRDALEQGGFTVADLGHVNAHGTSTHANDAMEYQALLSLGGEEFAQSIPVASIKGCTGHMLGGTGAVEAIVTALSVANDCVPPTVGFTTPDPECPVNVSNQPVMNLEQKVALTCNYGFGGHNAVLAIAPYKA